MSRGVGKGPHREVKGNGSYEVVKSRELYHVN
jgi:hypothetical protein